MRLLTLLLTLCLLIPSTARAEANIEEKVFTGTFAAFYAAEAFDDYCNKASPTSRNEMSNKENVRWHGNMKMLIATIAKLQMIKNEGLTLDMALNHLRKSASIIKGRAIKLFEEKGCDSKEALQAGKALALYRNSTPEVTHEIIEREIRKQGGEVTKLSEE